jgi:chromosome segregation ATPase
MTIPISKQARSILTGLVETFDAIDRVNGLEQVESDLRAKIERAKIEAESISKQSHQELDSAKAARAEAEQIKADGNKAARDAMIAAQKDAAAKIADMQAEADKRLADAVALRAAALAGLEAVNKEIAKAGNTLSATQNLVKSETETLAKIQDAIAAITKRAQG